MKGPVTTRHVVCYTVHVGMMENDEWVVFNTHDEAYDLYQELHTRDNVSNVMLTKPVLEKEHHGKKIKR